VEFGKYIGQTTNNVAEYQAVVEALKWLNSQTLMIGHQLSVQFFLDSKLVVNQLSGKYKIKDLKLKKLIVEVKELEKRINSKIVYYFISREKNYHADLLVNQVLNGKDY
jgi:ribonuclease HI